jgi:DNA-binding beta-propeller fold protein YncE
MDEQRFDAALRALNGATTRRQGLAAAFGMILGAGMLDALAKGANKGKDRSKAPGGLETEGPCGNGGPKANRCTKNKDCCTGICRQDQGKIRRCRCLNVGKTCKADRNCCGDMTCTKETCTRGGGGGGCTSDRDCPSSAPVCVDGECTEAGGCTSDRDCPSSAPVCVDGECTEAGGCTSDRDCPSSAVFCVNGTCTPGTWAWQSGFTVPTAGNTQAAPFGVAASADGLTAWITDTNQGNATVWTRPDAASTQWTLRSTFSSPGQGTGQLVNPSDLAVSSDELTLWIAATANNHLSVWTRNDDTSATWTYQSTIGSQGSGANEFFGPADVVVSADGLTMWVADSGNSRISVWRRANTATAWSNQTTFGSEGTDANQLQYPNGLAVSPDGLTVWVADLVNYRISVWTRPDAASIDWQPQITFGSEGTDANQFGLPYDIVAAPDGLTVWVTDRLNQRISIWTRPDADSTDWQPQTTFGTTGSYVLQYPAYIFVSADSRTAWVTEGSSGLVSVWTQS